MHNPIKQPIPHMCRHGNGKEGCQGYRKILHSGFGGRERSLISLQRLEMECLHSARYLRIYHQRWVGEGILAHCDIESKKFVSKNNGANFVFDAREFSFLHCRILGRNGGAMSEHYGDIPFPVDNGIGE